VRQRQGASTALLELEVLVTPLPPVVLSAQPTTTMKLQLSRRCLVLVAVLLLASGVALVTFLFLARSSVSSTTVGANNAVKVTECDDLGSCLIDTAGLDLDSDSISFELTTKGTVLQCDQVPTQGQSWHGNCNNGGIANLLKTGRKNARGEDLIHGSVVDADSDLICQLSPDAKGINRVLCTPTSDFPPEDEPHDLPPETDATVKHGGQHRNLALDAMESDMASDKMSLRRGDRQLLDDSGANLDILVVWTIQAECENSKEPAGCTLTAQTEINMRGLIDMAIEETNTAFENSGIDTKLHLVHAYRDPNYVESSVDPLQKALRAATLTSDGIMDDIHEKRTQVC